MLMVLRSCYTQGHVGLDPVDLNRLINSAPEMRDKSLLVPVILAALQTMASTPGATDTLVGWANQRRVAHVPCFDHALVCGPHLCPWDRRDLWSFGVYALAAHMVNRFLGQDQSVSESEFLASMIADPHLCHPSGREDWILETIAFVLYFVKNALWFWPTLARSDLSAFP